MDKNKLNTEAALIGQKDKKRRTSVQFELDDLYRSMLSDLTAKHNVTAIELLRQWIRNQHRHDFPERYK